MKEEKRVIVIGAGFAGLATAALLARRRFKVRVLEKNSLPGGRARVWRQDGFLFDMGPSWYLMSEVFERYFSHFQKSSADFYQLQKLDPLYRIYFEEEEPLEIPAELEEVKAIFEKIESGAAKKLG